MELVIKKSINVKKLLINIFLYTLLILISIFLMFPAVFMFFKSFMTYEQSTQIPVLFFPKELYFGNYKGIFDASMLKWFGNSLIIMVIAMIAQPLATCWIAFGFARLTFRGKKIFFAAMMATTMLPGVVMQIPMFILYNQLGWMNTLYPFIIPQFFGGGAISVFLVINFMRTVPKEMDNAALIDGASAYVRFFKMNLPLAFPVIIFMEIGIFMGVWNDYFGPLLYINDPDLYTLPFGIYMRFIRGTAEGSNLANGAKMAVGVIFSIPTALVFLFFQRQLIDGVMIGGVKG